MDANSETDNLDYLEEDDVSNPKRCRQEAAVGRLILKYLEKHKGWHLLKDACNETRAHEQYGPVMCLEVIQALINAGELDQEMRDSQRYIRFNEEQA